MVFRHTPIPRKRSGKQQQQLELKKPELEKTSIEIKILIFCFSPSSSIIKTFDDVRAKQTAFKMCEMKSIKQNQGANFNSQRVTS